MTYEHPPYTAPHKPEIHTHDLGVKVACSCGWWTTTPNRPRAARAYLAHLAEVKSASEGGGS